MKIEKLGTETTESSKRVCAHVSWEECERTPCDIYFETDRRFADSLECNPHAFLVGCVIPAFYYGEKRIFIDERICPELRDGLMTALTWIRHWFYPADRELIRIEAKVSSYGPRQKKEERAGLLFSGGVDSLTSLRWNRLNIPLEHPASIREAVLILWHHNEAPQTRRDIEDQMSVVAEDAEVELVPIGTNIFDLRSIINDVPWLNQWQGSVLAAVAHTLAGRLSQVSIAATLDISHMRPLGSHPVLDPNYGSSGLRIRHDGITLSRLAKTKLVAEWDTALQNLRVCNMVPQTGKTSGGTLNCGKCEKCLRTMLALVALGALHKTRAFPGRDVSADSVRELVHLDGTLPYTAHNYEELIAPLLDRGRIDLVLAIKDKLRVDRRCRKVAEWKSRVKHLDRKFLGEGLVKIKRAVLSCTPKANSYLSRLEDLEVLPGKRLSPFHLTHHPAHEHRQAAMEDTYLSTFDARGDLYNDAALIAPRARLIERQILIDLLRVEPHHVVVDAPAGGGYLAEGIRNLVREPSQIACVEPSKKFAEAIDTAFTKYINPLEDIPLGSGTIDRVGSLAGLHHLVHKARFFQEAYRVLKPGGLIVVGDVVERTPVAGFLNGPVDLYTTTGHRGVFLRESECASLLAATGFVIISEEHRRFHWEFESVEQLVRYCRALFGMVKATEHQVRDAIAQFFPLEPTPGSVKLPWSLVYGVGVKEG